MEKFLSNVVEWKGQSIIVCNFYDDTKVDYLIQNKSKLKYVLCEYIPNMGEELKTSKIVNAHILEKTSVAIL